MMTMLIGAEALKTELHKDMLDEKPGLSRSFARILRVNI